jgi:hypothetical protein
MEAQITFSSDHAQVEVHPQQHLVRLTWRCSATGEAYRAPSLAVLKAVRDFGLKHFLSDSRGLGSILFADRAWSEREVIPRLLEAGLVRIAIVSGTDGLQVIAVDNMVSTIPASAANVAYFDDPSMAQLWLLENDGVEVSIPAPGGSGKAGQH